MNYSSGNDAIENAINNSYQKTDPTRFCYTVPRNISLKEQTKAKICYVIATWSGERRQGNDTLVINASGYLEKHLKSLEKLKHSIDHIVIAVPENTEEPSEFTSFIKKLPSKLGKSKLSILYRENIGQSYGSYSDSYERYCDKYEYFIFIEDDYHFSQNNFDSILVQLFKNCDNCGYLCSRVDKYPPTNYLGRPHAAISNGIASNKSLKKVKDMFGKLPYGGNATKAVAYTEAAQLEFSWGFLDAGLWLYDYKNYFSAPYHHVGKLQVYGNQNLPSLIQPTQFAKL
jgi:hypothetical protein